MELVKIKFTGIFLYRYQNSSFNHEASMKRILESSENYDTRSYSLKSKKYAAYHIAW